MCLHSMEGILSALTRVPGRTDEMLTSGDVESQEMG